MADNKEPTLAEQLKEALAAMTPALVGGIVGGMGGGGLRGQIGGMEAGQKASDQYQQLQLQRQKAIAQQQLEQQALLQKNTMTPYQKATIDRQKAEIESRERIAKMEAQARQNARNADQQRKQEIHQLKVSKALDSKEASLDITNNSIEDMEKANKLLDEGGVTGFIDGTLGATFDKLRGNPKAAGRLLLEKLKVDDALLRVAKTKGAISDKEMKLFLSPAPTMLDDEKTWKAWIAPRLESTKKIRDRLSKGSQVKDPATEEQLQEYSQSLPQESSKSSGRLEQLSKEQRAELYRKLQQ